MTTQHPLDAFGLGLRTLIERGFPPNDADFNRLALELFALQFEHNQPFQRLCRHRGISSERVSSWREIPAVPAAAFKELDLTSLTPEERTTEFHSSGTTKHRPSRHFHSAASLAVYEASLLAWFDRHLVFGKSRLPTLALTPCAAEAPHSSLVHMFERVLGEFGGEGSGFFGSVDASGSWTLNESAALTALLEFAADEQPIIILGTAFSFVHLLDCIEAAGTRFTLPAGSSVMETGGYKGRSRELPKVELHRLITDQLDVLASNIVCEYGMSELSSQAYDSEVRTAGPSRTGQSGVGKRQRVFHFPPWVRVQIVSPETGREVGEGETGLIRVFDLANVRSVIAVQTEDLGVSRGVGFELVGRAELAESRGCSLMAV